jgi:hypothetical protein
VLYLPGCPEDVLELGKQFVGYQIDKMTNFVNVTVEDRLGHVAQRFVSEHCS